MAEERTSTETQDVRLSPESRVGLFVLAGLVVLVISILMLGDIQFKPQNKLNIRFHNIEGITANSLVKISGVEIGKVSKVQLDDGGALIRVHLGKDIALYKNAHARVRSTGIIGSKYVALNPGAPEPGTDPDSQRLESGATIQGEDALSLDDVLERAAKSLDGLTGGGKLGDNLNATMSNLRSITDSLNAAIGKQQRSMVNIVKNMEDFSAHAKAVGAHLDDILTKSKNDIEVAVHSLRETLERVNTILAGVQRGEGAVGALVSNHEVGENIKQTLENLKQTSESAKQVLARFTKVRAFWDVTSRYDFKAGVGRGDVGIRLEPRPEKFYYIAGQNLGNDQTIKNSPNDYEHQNTLTALIGRHWGTFTTAAGFIKSRGGIELRYRPFQDQDLPVLNRLELVGQGFDFGRNDIFKGRNFKVPNYMAGLRYRVNKYVSAGMQVEDIAETTDYTGALNISFEDRDLAYLLGFVSFAR